MSRLRHQLLACAGILLASGLHLACDTTASTDPSGSPDGGLSFLFGGGNQGGGGTGDPVNNDPTDPADPALPNNNGTNEPGDPGDPPPNNVVAPDTRPVTFVTTLEDNPITEYPIPGSIRWAVKNAPTPGIIRFQVGGAINLKWTLTVKRPDLEIDGSTAPNGGITFQQQQFEVRDTHNVVLKNLRFRSGDGFKSDAERVAAHGEYYDVTSPTYAGGQRSLAMVGEHGPCRNIRIENCSIQNSTDDNASVWGDCGGIHFYRCLFSGGYTELTKALLCGSKPGTAVPSHPQWVTLQQCLFVDQWARMPDMTGETAHLVNNVIIRPMQGGRMSYCKANVVGNCLYSVPNHPWHANADKVLAAIAGTTPNGGLYISGNLLDGVFDSYTKIVGIVNQGENLLPDIVYRAEPHPGLPTGVVPAHQALFDVLSNAGCKGPGRDEIDLTEIDRAAGFVGVDAATVR